MVVRVITGDCRDVLPTLPERSVQVCVTSPPYFGLRSYLPAGHPDKHREIGAEKVPDCLGWATGEPCGECFVCHLVEVFRQVRRVLRDDGTLWLVIGDSYNSGSGGGDAGLALSPASIRGGGHKQGAIARRGPKTDTLKPKDLVMVPARLALALQADGWYLRMENVWHKRSCLSGGAIVYAKTQKGEMPTTIKDLVRLDPATVKLWNGEKWTQVVAFDQSSGRDGALEIELRSGERIGCTPEHIWPTQRGNTRADDLKVGDVIPTVRLPQPGDPACPRMLTDEAGWFAGLYLAEGHRYGDVIGISGHEKEQIRWDRLQRFVESYHGRMSLAVHAGHARCAQIHGSVLHGIIDAYVSGTGAKGKHLNPRVWGRDDGFLAALLDGYLAADGHYDAKNDRWRIGFTNNDALAADLRAICARLGHVISLRRCTHTNQHGSYPGWRGEIRTVRSAHQNNREMGRIVAIRASRARKFWDISVEDEPHLFALASGVLTHNCMPESVTDRTTRAHEMVYVFSKAPRYFYDAVAVAEEGTGRDPGNNGHKYAHLGGTKAGLANIGPAATRNLRSVWSLSSEPLKGEHYAAFPTEIPKRAILAGTSARGCCPACGAGWVRVVERIGGPQGDHTKGAAFNGADEAVRATGRSNRAAGAVLSARYAEYGYPEIRTTGWRPACSCDAGDPRPCTVLDPFGGAGTTGLVADRLGRDAVLIDLNPAYAQMGKDRITNDAPLFAVVASA